MRPWLVLAVVTGCGDDAATPAADAPVEPGACESGAPWARAAQMPGPTQETATVAIDGKLYVLGGFDGELAVVDAVQVFDIASCRWSAGPPLPEPVHHANAAVVDGTIYVVGAMATLQFTPLGVTWSWNPATESAWTVRAPMPEGTGRGSAVVGVLGGKLHVAGGLRGGAVTDHHVYDPALDQWSVAEPLPSARDHACGGTVGGKLYVVGGRDSAIESIAPTVFEYAPGAGWVTQGPMPTARGGMACGVIGDRLIVVGGEGNRESPSGVFPQTEVFDAIDRSWSSSADMPTPRHGMGAAAWDGKLYVPGGATTQGFGAVATHEVLTP